jgi:nucleotide-binding universal stress UspA family protein
MKLKSPRRSDIVSMETHEVKAPSSAIDAPDVRLRKILIPIDFSELSRKALHYANALAKQSRAGMFLLHVVEPVPLVTSEFAFAAASVSDFRPSQKEATRRIATWRKAIDSSVPVLTLVRAGESAREIVTAASECDCDLIVIGTHGRTGLDRMMMGSTAERVVRFAPCPVLVVREREQDFIRPVPTREHRHGLRTKRRRTRRHNRLL